MMNITKTAFEEILDGFAENGILFSNERQFQLALAWKLKELGYKVLLEVLDNSTDKKYIDIVIELNDKELVVVELKYTTRQKDLQYYISGKCVPTFSQGAGDVRQYDFLKDVQRIEELLKKNDGVFGIDDAKVIKGFSIIMTNDNYWGKKGEGTGYHDVALYAGNTFESDYELSLNIKGYKNRKPIKLKKSYTCQWKDYNLNNTNIQYKTPSGKLKDVVYSEYPFKYMIFEIKD